MDGQVWARDERRAARWMGLRAQMTRSYILVTLIAVAISEALRYLLDLLLLVVSGRSLPPVPWYVLFGVDLYLLLFVPLIGGLFGVISTRRMIRRIDELAAATARFAAGRYDQRLLVWRADEVGRLEENFNAMAAQLVESIAERQQLAEHGARQEERARIARDLHDSVKQQAFAISMQVAAALARLDADPEAARRFLTEAEALAHGIQEELMALIHTLHPLALGERGLARALRDFLAAWERHHGIAAALHVPEDCMLPPQAAEALLRVAREALTNVARHSGARTVSVTLDCDPVGITLSIVDDGGGFTPKESRGAGIGLHSMRERLEVLGGTLTIESAIGRGTHVRARCPIVPTDAHGNGRDGEVGR